MAKLGRWNKHCIPDFLAQIHFKKREDFFIVQDCFVLAMGILVPWPGIKPILPAVEAQS